MPGHGGEGPVEFIRGHHRILAVHAVLLQIAALSGQAQDAEDLAYFLSTPDALKKDAALLLVRGEPGQPAVMGFSAAVLVFEYKLPLNVGRSRVFSTADLTGRRTVFAARHERPRIAALAMRFLLEKAGAHIVHIAFSRLPQDPSSAIPAYKAMRTAPELPCPALWTFSERKVLLYLPLEGTFEQTLARIGQRTRSNLRYYPRRTQRDLGCHFVENVEITLADFLAFNRECMYTVPDELARWRYASLATISRPLLAGIKDRSGRWLSIVGGRRRTREIEIDWQMNRDRLPLYSLATVMRACLIEYEITQGTTRIYIEGGTPQFIGRSFVEEGVAELTIRRQSMYASALTRLPRWLFPVKNYVAQILQDRTQCWHHLDQRNGSVRSED